MGFNKKEYQEKYYRKHKDHLKSQAKKYYKNHIEYYKQYSKEYYKNHREKWLLWVTDLGLNKCLTCGYNKCFEAIDFHHLDPKKKDRRMANIFNCQFSDKNKDRILKELDECMPLCSNCHRELHAKIKKGLIYGSIPNNTCVS